jgi:hypothetical protein
MLGSTRLWRASAGRAPRALPLLRRLIGQGRACALHRRLLFCTEGLCSDVRAVRETFRDAVSPGARGRPRLCPWPQRLSAQVVTRYEQQRVVGIERRILQGTATQGEQVRAASQGEGVINPASIERLNATFGARRASLTSRGRALACHVGTLKHGRYLLGTVSNVCATHERLGVVQTTTSVASVRTPAMAAGLPDHCWPVRELLAFHVPPRGGPRPRSGGVHREHGNP